MNKFDLGIIGGGPGGYLAAERAAQGGLKVVLWEKATLGGVCLNEGCMPTKTFLHSAKLYHQALNSAAYGVTVSGAVFDQAAVLRRKDQIVKALVNAVGVKMKNRQIEVINAPGIISEQTPEGFLVNDEILCQRLIIASGSETVKPNIPGLAEGLAAGHVLTNREILQVSQLPQSLTVIGAGVSGLELAVYFAKVGVKVTVVELLDKIGGTLDGELAAALLKDLSKTIDFKLGYQVVKIDQSTLLAKKGEDTIEISADKIFLSVGRRPVLDGTGHQNIRLYTEKGAIVTDEFLRTNIADVYAIGDVNGRSMLAHTAYREAEVAVNHILGKADRIDYDTIPSVIYTTPEIAMVGDSEESAKAKGLNYSVKKLSMRYASRFMAENQAQDGICKLLIDNNSQRLLGVHLLGSYVSEIIYGAALMLESRYPLKDLKKLVFPHPTVSEIIRETMFAEDWGD